MKSENRKNTMFFILGTVFTVLSFIFKDTKIELLQFLSYWNWIGLAIMILLTSYSIYAKSKKWIIYISIFISGILLGDGLFSFFSSGKNNQERIAVLIPGPYSKSEAVKDDGKLQLAGVMDFIMQNDSLMQKYNVVFLDHQNDTSVAKEKVSKEINRGTKYFFSTMSAVNECLSNEFLSNKKIPKDAILMCAVTSSNNINTRKGKVYRYYIRSNEEGKTLALEGCKSFKQATVIVVGDNYGKGAAKAFKEYWNDSGTKIQDDEMFILPKDANKEGIKNYISKREKFMPQEPRAILICHYGEGIANIVQALKELDLLGDSTSLFFTSTINNNRWKKQVEQILEKGIHYYSTPDYHYSEDCKEVYNDDVKDFSHFAMEKFIKSIDQMNSNTSFDDAYKRTNIPSEHTLSVHFSNDGDNDVPMKVVSNKINNKK